MEVAPLQISPFTHISWYQLGCAVTKKNTKTPQSFMSNSRHMPISGLLGPVCVAMTLGPRLTEQAHPEHLKFTSAERALGRAHTGN